MKILITGSHFTPAQATAEELQKIHNSEIVYIGRKHTIEGDSTLSQESQIFPKIGVKFIPIVAGRVRRIPDFQTFASLLKIPIGFIQSFYYLIKESPDVVLSFGGYVGVPVVFSAWLLNIPVIVHEQTLVSGLANRISNFFADKIAVSFNQGYSFDSDKTILTGNPIRKELLENAKNSKLQISGAEKIGGILSLAKKNHLLVIYVTGGNQGSHVVNMAVSEILADLTDKFFVIHQTGDSNFRDFEKLVKEKDQFKNPQRYFVKKWFDVDDVSLILKNSDLVVSRAGVNTLFEFALFGIPTIVVPLPYLYKDEQNTNAKFFHHLGLCEILPQSSLNGRDLLKKIGNIFRDYNHFRKLALDAKKVVVLDAAKRLAQETLILGKK